eukprot:302595-Rhodomonas_salina.1
MPENPTFQLSQRIVMVALIKINEKWEDEQGAEQEGERRVMLTQSTETSAHRRVQSDDGKPFGDGLTQLDV